MKQLIKSIVPTRTINRFKAIREGISDNKNRKIYAGDDVHCPVCGSSYRVFGSYGFPPRENARCFTCGSLERHRLLYMYLDERHRIFDANKALRLLHFAPEEIFYNRLSANPSIDYVPCDLSPRNFIYGNKTKIVKVDITKIPFEDESFDFILCNHVLEHIPDDALAMSELFRVLAKGGVGIFQVPIDYNRDETYEDFDIVTPEERQKAFGQSDHVRWYGKDYPNRLESAGFKVHVDDLVTKFSSSELHKYGLVPSERIYECSK